MRSVSGSTTAPRQRVGTALDDVESPQTLLEGKPETTTSERVFALLESIAIAATGFASMLFVTHTMGDALMCLASWGMLYFCLCHLVKHRVKRFVLVVIICLSAIGVVLLLFSKGLLVPDVRNKVMVIYAKEHIWPPGLVTAGIMASIKHVLGALRYAELHGAVAVKVVFIDGHYSDPAMPSLNYFSYFFQQPMIMKDGLEQTADLSRLPEVHFNQKFKKYGAWGGFQKMIEGSQSATYPLTYALDREGVNRLMHKYLRLHPTIAQKIDNFKATHLKDADVVIGVHYRGTDTAEHWPYKKTPYEKYFAEVDKVLPELLKEKGLEAGKAKIRIFVASDEAAFLDKMKERYPGQVVSNTDSPRLTPDQYAAATEGLTNSPDVQVSNYMKGESTIVDAILLAAGEYLIKGRSNVSEFAFAFNMNMGVSQIFLDITRIPKGNF